MSITDAFVLPSGVELLPVSELGDEIRLRVNASDGEFAIARAGGRVSAKLIDRTTATLLRRFATPRTIVDAIIETSKELDEDPEQMLREAHPILLRIIGAGLLVPSETAGVANLEPQCQVGDSVAGWVVRSCLQVLIDTELYIVTQNGGEQAVLKMARKSDRKPLGDIEREMRALARINGGVAPNLYHTGTEGGRAFLVMELRPGILVSRAATELRQPSPASRRELATLACAVADAYADLHARGVVHGDVHEGNVLVDRVGRVTLVDYGLSRLAGEELPADFLRGGLSFYIEPEFAAALLDKVPHPPPTEASDQYSLAAMLYSLFAGARYLDFEMVEERGFRQIVKQRMLPFTHWGAASWPAVERVLGRALSKRPEARFGSMAEFARELRAACIVAAAAIAPKADSQAAARARAARTLLKRIVQASLTDEAAPMPAPTASLIFGCAGVGAALYRLALLHNDPALLAQADRWSERAAAESRRRRGFHSADLTPGMFGRRSFQYGGSGPHVVRGLIAQATGEFMTMNDAIRSLETLPADAGSPRDLYLGVPGALVGLSLLLEAAPDGNQVNRTPLLRAGQRCQAAIKRSLARLGDIGDEYGFANLGLAHGWGGAVYAQLRWHQASGTELAPSIRPRLDQLADLAEPFGRGLRWPWRDVRRRGESTHGYMAGFCNGSAGFVHIFLAAHDVFGESRFLEVAEGAAWHAWEGDEGGGFDLCCGSAGRAYALLALYRTTGDDRWLHRARMLADESMDAVVSLDDAPFSLYKGALGPLLLHAEIEHPHLARMPMFESENWPRSGPAPARRRR